jgi:inosose dehydratase
MAHEAWDRLAGAPISWGVCEVPGWGRMLPADRVLDEMCSVGLTATEQGAPGFLPSDPGALRDVLERHGMRLVGGFVPVVMHDPAAARDALVDAHRIAAGFEKAGADVFVSTAVVDADWSPRFELSTAQWDHLCTVLAEIDRIATEHGLRHVLHPHVGTLVETATDVERVLEGSDVSWCLDTGHLAIGGYDPVVFAERYGARVGHVHLKDVNHEIASRLTAGELSLMAAVQHGLFRPLGTGDIPVGRVVQLLEREGYQGWYVFEQDQAITGDEPPMGSGPITDVVKSVEYLRALLGSGTNA